VLQAIGSVGFAQTAAFLLPMLERLKEHSNTVGVRGVVLSPTRELAIQTLKFFRELGRNTTLRACLLVGGDSMEAQFEGLSRNPDVLIATPGRLMHHLEEVGMSLNAVQVRTRPARYHCRLACAGRRPAVPPLSRCGAWILNAGAVAVRLARHGTVRSNGLAADGWLRRGRFIGHGCGMGGLHCGGT
jgi:hypothetical protein